MLHLARLYGAFQQSVMLVERVLPILTNMMIHQRTESKEVLVVGGSLCSFGQMEDVVLVLCDFASRRKVLEFSSTKKAFCNPFFIAC